MTIRSMTGYGQGAADLDGLRVTVEMRSVNNRFADVRLRLPTELAPREREIRQRILSRVRRGRVDVTVNVGLPPEASGGALLNRSLLEQVLAAGEALRAHYGMRGELDLGTVLALPGMLRGDTLSPEWGDEAWDALCRALDEALEALDADRLREGENLRQELLRRAAEMNGLTARIRTLAADVPATVRDRLLERLNALAGEAELDPARVAQEAVLLADRADVTEEIVRLEGHLEQLGSLLGASDGEPVGKRLDFLLQEILRETNTVNSKPAVLELSRAALELKAECEKVREQIQNLE